MRRLIPVWVTAWIVVKFHPIPLNKETPGNRMNTRFPGVFQSKVQQKDARGNLRRDLNFSLTGLYFVLLTPPHTPLP